MSRALTRKQVDAVEQRFTNRHNDITDWYAQVEDEDMPRLLKTVRKQQAEIDRLLNVQSNILDQWEKHVDELRHEQKQPS